jgi:hypothetical protein
VFPGNFLGLFRGIRFMLTCEFCKRPQIIIMTATKHLCQRSSYSFTIVLMLLSSLSFVASTQSPFIPFVYATTSEEDDDEQQEEGEEQDQQAEDLPETQVPSSSPQQTVQQQQQHQPLEDFILSGKVNTVLPIGNNTWIADGDWGLENGC